MINIKQFQNDFETYLTNRNDNTFAPLYPQLEEIMGQVLSKALKVNVDNYVKRSDRTFDHFSTYKLDVHDIVSKLWVCFFEKIVRDYDKSKGTAYSMVFKYFQTEIHDYLGYVYKQKRDLNKLVYYDDLELSEDGTNDILTFLQSKESGQPDNGFNQLRSIVLTMSPGGEDKETVNKCMKLFVEDDNFADLTDYICDWVVKHQYHSGGLCRILKNYFDSKNITYNKTEVANFNVELRYHYAKASNSKLDDKLLKRYEKLQRMKELK